MMTIESLPQTNPATLLAPALAPGWLTHAVNATAWFLAEHDCEKFHVQEDDLKVIADSDAPMTRRVEALLSLQNDVENGLNTIDPEDETGHDQLGAARYLLSIVRIGLTPAAEPEPAIV